MERDKYEAEYRETNYETGVPSPHVPSKAEKKSDAAPLEDTIFTRRGPAQDVPFFYTPFHLSELQSFK